MHHCFFVDLLATLLDKVKQLLESRSPRIQDVVTVFCGLETDYTHRSVASVAVRSGGNGW